MSRKSIALILLAGSGFVLVAGAWATRAFTQDVEFRGRVAAPPVLVQPQTIPPGTASAPGANAPPTGAPAAGLGLLSTTPTGPGGFPMLGGTPVNNLAVRVFPLKHASANAVAQILTSLVPDGETRIAVDPRTNSLIVRCHDGELAGVNALVTELDADRPASSRMTTVAVGTSGQLGITSVPVTTFEVSAKTGMVPLAGAGSAESQSLNEARRHYEQADTAARRLGHELQRSGRDPARDEELRRYVRDAFAARQRVMRQEIVELQRRLIAIQEAVDLRDRVAEQIIERRAVELSVPEVQWDSPLQRSSMGMPSAAEPSTTLPTGSAPGVEMIPMHAGGISDERIGNRLLPSVPTAPPAVSAPVPAGATPGLKPQLPTAPSASPPAQIPANGIVPALPPVSGGSPATSGPAPTTPSPPTAPSPAPATSVFDPLAPEVPVKEPVVPESIKF